eukprot:1190512-Prorocentrum_minimum.AAC.2
MRQATTVDQAPAERYGANVANPVVVEYKYPQRHTLHTQGAAEAFQSCGGEATLGGACRDELVADGYVGGLRYGSHVRLVLYQCVHFCYWIDNPRLNKHKRKFLLVLHGYLTHQLGMVLAKLGIVLFSPQF